MDLNQLVKICKDPERKERLKSVTKEQMADVLVLHTSELGSDYKNLRQGMETMVKEMQELRKTNEKMVVALEKMERLEREMVSLKNDNEELRNQMAKQAEVIKQHQIFLERVDQKERAPNLLMLGIDEDSTPDEGKAMQIIEKLSDNTREEIRIEKTKRLGAPAGGKKRPLLVMLVNASDRDDLVERARNRRDLGEGVRVKKDSHPAVRAEWKRLFEQKEAEEKKAENAGCTITLDMRKRQLLRDGQVIDSWCQQLF